MSAAARFSATGAWPGPTTPEQARTAVLNWLGLEALPLGAALGLESPKSKDQLKQ